MFYRTSKTFKVKLLAAAFLASMVIFLITFFVVRISAQIYYNTQADDMTELISASGEVPENHAGISEEAPFSTRYFIVTEGTVNLEHVSSVDAATARLMAEEAKSSGKTTGYISYYRYRVNGSQVVFLDCSSNFSFLTILTKVLGTTALSFPFLITLIFFFISNYIMRPFEENAALQKQFITDAGHELKTPLAVISANASALEYKTGESTYLTKIEEQTTRMGELIDGLLALVKTDTARAELTVCDFSALVQEYTEDFRLIFEQKNVELQTDITPGVSVCGTQLQMLVSCLLDNAAKYVTEGGTASVALTANGKQAVLQVYNTALIDKNLNLNKLFVRFYRPDASRNSGTGGHGIGLSAARSIAERSGGTITAKRKDAGIVFTVVLKRK